MRRRVAAAALPLLLAIACGGGSGGAHAAPPPPRAASGSALDLQSVCPATISVQTAATPRVEQGALYRLLGADAAVETGEKRVTGELVASNRDTGVRLEIRAGAAGGGAQVPALLYADTSLTLAIVSTDEAVLDWRDHPTLAVTAPLDIDPAVILWSPVKHPDWASIADIGKAGGTVLAAAGATSVEYLLASGALRRTQVDSTYDGTPARFVASGGTIAQQGRVTDEPFVYSRELPAWNRQVRFQLVHETGYPAYADAVAIRPADRARLAPCLQRLVPILQRSAVTYAGNPKPADASIVTLAHDLGAAPAYTAARAAFAADELRRLGVVGNGSNSTIGDFDSARVQRIVDLLVKAGRTGGPGPRAQDLATNEFIDPAVGL